MLAIPIYLLAGQSNARAMREEIRQSLEHKHGTGGFVLVETSASGAPLTYKRPEADWAAFDELRQQLTQDTAQALQAAPRGQIAGLIWVQGEGDTYDIARAEEYSTRLEALIDGLRRDIAEVFGPRDTGITLAPVALCRLSEHATGGNLRANWDGVIAQQEAFVAAQPLAALVNPDRVAQLSGVATDQMFSDGLHYHPTFKPDLADALVAALGGDGGSGAGRGNDILRGTRGADLLEGGQGDDTYIVDHAGDRVREAADAGIDLVLAGRSFSLRFHSQHLENLTLTGTGDLNAVGNGQDNVMNGNSGNNILKGAWGDDLLFGGAGNDTFIDNSGRNRMIGGAGDDTYYIDRRSNRIVEEAGQGTDSVVASVSFTLRYHSQHLENLTLTGRADIFGTGNGQNNVMTGNRGNNRLDGAWGDDVLSGGAGDDVLIGHVGNDVLAGGPGSDTFVFSSRQGQDMLRDFEPGHDRLGFDGIPREALTLVQDGADTRLGWGEDDGVTLLGIDAGSLTDADFFFF